MRERPDDFYRQSAVIPFRREPDSHHDLKKSLKIMLITSRKKKRWIIPKGIIEPNLSPADSAAKEALEEAGIEGTVRADAIGSYQYKKWGDVCTVEVFVMEVSKVLDAWLEDFRDRAWLDLEKVVDRIDEPKLKKLIRQVPAFLGKGSA